MACGPLPLSAGRLPACLRVNGNHLGTSWGNGNPAGSSYELRPRQLRPRRVTFIEEEEEEEERETNMTQSIQ